MSWCAAPPVLYIISHNRINFPAVKKQSADAVAAAAAAAGVPNENGVCNTFVHYAVFFRIVVHFPLGREKCVRESESAFHTHALAAHHGAS